ncbi:MAG: hypothetical protein KAR20_07340, partial [Candidatus Heimdallarchaeota archaeon]|nr:hypothetical protein [Candidatus Heimdallarchaeota archaeon]
TSVEKIQPQLTTGKDKLITSVQEKLAHQTTVFTNFMDNFLNNYKQMGVAIESELHQNIADKVSDLHGTTAEFLEDFTTEIDAAKNTIRDQFHLKEEENIAFLDHGLKTLTTEYETLSGTLKTHITTTTAQVSTELIQSLESTDESMKNLSETNSQEFTDKITATRTQFTAQSDDTGKQYAEETQGTITQFKEKISGLDTGLTAKLTQHREAEEKSLMEVVSTGKTLGTTHIEALKTQLDKLQAAYNTNIDAQLTGFDQFKDETGREFLEKNTAFKDALGTTISNIQKDFDSLIGVKTTDLTTSLQKILSTHTTSMKENLQSLTTTLSTSTIESALIFKELEELFKDTIEKIKTTTQKSIDTGRNVLNEELGKVFKSALGTMNSVKNLGEEPIKIMESAWKTMTSIDVIQAEKTWHLVGEEAIYPYIESMIQNVKSKLTLVLPSWKNLLFDALMAKKARMTIIASIPPGEADEQIEKLKEKGAQIMDYSGQDFIAVDRDGEELLFAPVSAEENPTTAIISEVEPMIRIVGSMINDYWRSKARKL